MASFQPADAQDVAEIVAAAMAAKENIAISGGGSKRALGRPVETIHHLDLGRLSGIVDYDPAELVLTAQAATPLAEISRALAAEKQMLAFEPPDWCRLLGGDGAPTLGGLIACNQAGPRRVRSGSARDHFLGFSAVNGRGELWKAGGRVVKNVTGYDMSKLQAGAFGTLSALLELTVKVVPRPETSRSVAVIGLSTEEAIAVLADGLNSPHEVNGAAHLPGPVARRSSIAEVAGAGVALTLLRLEGHGPSVAYRAAALAAALPPGLQLDATASTAVWQEIAAVQPLLATTDSVVWRLCPTPALAAQLVNRLAAALPGCEGYVDWGGGLVWLSLDPASAADDAGAGVVRAAMAAVGGHATLIRAPASTRARVAVFQPLPAPLAALTRRVKAGFDPEGILNPGRIHEGI
jgi:glycolate oxidase FAD binding subunit